MQFDLLPSYTSCLFHFNNPSTTFESPSLFPICLPSPPNSRKAQGLMYPPASSLWEWDHLDRQWFSSFQLAVGLSKASSTLFQMQGFMCLCLKVCLCCGGREDVEGERGGRELVVRNIIHSFILEMILFHSIALN